MKRIILIIIAAACCMAAASAQQKGDRPEHRWAFTVSGGAALNVYENAFSYWDNGRAWGLVTPQIVMGTGYDFTRSWGMRLMLGYGRDAGACNVKQTSGGGFYPYSFSHVNGFLDAVFDTAGKREEPTNYHMKLYTGMGYARSFAFSDPGHPWQKVTGKNRAFGFRAGIIAEYRFTSWFGIHLDACGEAWTDSYNGLRPSDAEQENYKGYGGFPFDLRGTVSMGLTFYM